MFTTKSSHKRNALGKTDCGCKPITDVGLGDDVSQEYGGQSKIGQYVNIGASLYNPLTGMIPPGIAGKLGVTNPMSMSLAVMTGGLTAIPGISTLVNKVFGHMFAKATHMESCMKYWTDSNIRNMVTGIAPLPFDLGQVFPLESREYYAEHARDVSTNPVVNNLLNISARQSKIADYFVQIVRSNSDIMQMQCMSMPQGRAETGYSGPDPAPYWDQFKESAKQQELVVTAQAIQNVLAPYAARVEKVVVKEMASRQENLLTSVQTKRYGPQGELLMTVAPPTIRKLGKK